MGFSSCPSPGTRAAMGVPQLGIPPEARGADVWLRCAALRLFSVRRWVSCPPVRLLLRPSRYAVRFLCFPCLQKVLSLSGIHALGKDSRGEFPGPDGRHRRVLHRTQSGESFRDGFDSGRPEVMTREQHGEGRGMWAKNSRQDGLDLPVSMRLLNHGKEAGKMTPPPTCRVPKEKLELRAQMSESILQTLVDLCDVKKVGHVLNEWLRKFASESYSFAYPGGGQRNYSTARVVSYGQVARIMHSVIKGLGQRGHFEATLEVLRWMEEQGWCQLDPHMYTTVIAILGETGNFELAEKIFESLEVSQVEKDPALFNAVLNARGKAGQIDSLEDLFAFMKSSACKPDLLTYNTVMNWYVKAGMGLGTVVDVFKDMYSKGIAPDVVSFDILLQACVSGKHVREAQKIFENMKRRSLTPSVVTYTTLITLYAKSGHSGEALQLLKDMVGENCQPNAHTLSSLITACGRDGKVEEAERLFQNMKALGVEANVVTYNAMIDMYGKEGDCEKAVQKYKELARAGLKPTGVTITSVMSCLKAAEAYEEVLAFYDVAKDEALCNEHVFSEILDALIKWGKVQSIKQVQSDMLAVNCSPNVVTCSILLAALGSKCSNREDARLLIDFLLAFESSLTSNTCRLLLKEMTSMDEVLHNIHGLFVYLDKEEMKTWTIFTSALVDALWALGWYRRAALVVAWVMERGLFEDLCVVHPQEWKLDLRRLSSGTALVALYQWFSHLVRLARHINIYLANRTPGDAIMPEDSEKEEPGGKLSRGISGAFDETVPQDLEVAVEVLLPLLPKLPDSFASRAGEEVAPNEFGTEFPPLMTIVTGWGKLSKQEGSSVLKTSVQKEILKLRAPFSPSIDSGRLRSTSEMLVPWLMNPATAKLVALSDIAGEVDSVHQTTV